MNDPKHESTRATFETWLRSRHITALDRHNMPLGTYQSDPVQCMWEGWCAALEHAKGDWDGEAFKRGVLAGTSSVTENGVRKEIRDVIVERDTCKSEWEKAVGVAGMLRTELEKVKSDLKHAKQYGAATDQTATTFMNQVKHLQTPAGALEILGGWMKHDPDYAWTWHCNIAMAIHDCGGRPHSACNEGAARFLALLFPGVDTTKHPAYEGTQRKGEKCPECGAPEVESMSARTRYACGSSDYDQRPLTFKRGPDCKSSTPQTQKPNDLSMVPWSFETRPQHTVWVYRKGYISDRLITIWKDDCVGIAGVDGFISYDQLFHDWLCRDGSPCGHVAKSEAPGMPD